MSSGDDIHLGGRGGKLERQHHLAFGGKHFFVFDIN